ncbi:MAG TPA: urate hydroxylase PuuD [Kiritimatiellia bacterium]|nr:urate hydroxylase PuuD [Kiritimatiellia bacterium]
MDPVIAEWVNIIGRWIHVIAGIMWVGNSMLFNWLDRTLIPPGDPNSRTIGKTWLLHGGGFYFVEKYTSDEVPKVLHWFKWQAYTTWVTGFILLVAVYYADGGNFLLPPESAWTPGEALLLGLAMVFGGFLLYDLAWRLPFAKKHSFFFGVLSLGVLFAITYGIHQVFTGRSAYLHVGAMLGTFMAGNVFLHITPSQKALIKRIHEGGGYSVELSQRAKTRSIHNNYFTFPMIFTMISNHFAGLFGHELNWLILIVIMIAGAMVRHFMNIRWTFHHWQEGIGATLGIAGVALMAILHPGVDARGPVGGEDWGEPVSFAEARVVINNHCLSCHSQWPTDRVLSLATGGVHFDFPSQIKQYADRILVRAVETRTMPMAVGKEMPEEERELIGRWIRQGAKLD